MTCCCRKREERRFSCLAVLATPELKLDSRVHGQRADLPRGVSADAQEPGGRASTRCDAGREWPAVHAGSEAAGRGGHEPQPSREDDAHAAVPASHGHRRRRSEGIPQHVSASTFWASTRLGRLWPNADADADADVDADADELFSFVSSLFSLFWSALDVRRIQGGGLSAGGAGGAAAQEQEKEEVVEQTSFDVILAGFDAKSKVKVIKEVRAITGLGLKDAKEMVEGAPKPLRKAVPKEEAEELKEKLEGLGATVEIK
eukprot:scaffold3474_cov246-Pinguiococcus_pyrenoidosus.AAC.14